MNRRRVNIVELEGSIDEVIEALEKIKSSIGNAHIEFSIESNWDHGMEEREIVCELSWEE